MKLKAFVSVSFVFAIFALVGVISVSAQTATPSPSPTPRPGATPRLEDEEIKIDTELVNITVRVVDRNNRPVNNLPQSDFKIYEDGVLQEIGFFSKSEVPTNYSLLVDNSGSLRQQIEQIIEAGKYLVGTNRAEDETAIIRFVSSDKIEVLQDFSKNKTDLNDALDNMYIEGGQTAIIDAVYLAVERLNESATKQKDLDRTRRAIVLVTDGEDRSSYYSETQLLEMLKESDVQIFVVGFVKALSEDKGFISKSPQGKAKAFLERLATSTGGKSYFPASGSEMGGIAKEIASELRTQYSIGFIPSNDKKDGSFRNIRVSIPDGPGASKRIAITRAGRTAEKEGAPPKLN
ncbi:MAG: VWA domain-containing protein [Pyrinomonadaceae bacterium]